MLSTSAFVRRVGAPHHPGPGCAPNHRASIVRPQSPRALPDLLVLADAAAKGAPGSVDAPVGVIIGAAALVTAGSLLLSLGLKSGERPIQNIP